MKKALAVICFLFLVACNAVPPSGLDGSASSPLTETPSPGPFSIVSNTPAIFSTDTATSVPVTETPTAPAWTPVPSATPRINTPLKSGLRVNISSIKMIDSQTGWGFDSDFHILKTDDGGNTWYDVTPPVGRYEPGGFFALDSEAAWATFSIGLYSMPVSAHVWRTTDGGQTWNASQEFRLDVDQYGEPYSSEFYIPRKMQFMDAQTGWLLTYVAYNMNSARPLFLHTDDGGATWTTINSRLELPDACSGVGFAFVDPLTGWVGGNCFWQGVVSNRLSYFLLPDGWAIHKTADGGRTYEQKTFLPLPEELQQADLLDRDGNCGEINIDSFAQDVVGIEWGCTIFAHLRADYTYFALSSDGGQTWTSWKSSGNEEFIDGQHGWRLLSTGELQQTVDGGVNWNTIKYVTWSDAQFDFINESEGWAIVSNTRESTLLHTTDGGSRWQELRQLIVP